jgi:orotate phosphoribosyltransferase
MENPAMDVLSNDERALRSILRRKSVRQGDFTLASGQHSTIYVDGKLTTCSAEAMPLVGRTFLQKMRSRNWNPESVGGLTVGADPIAFAIARESVHSGQAIDAFIVRKEPKKHGMQRYIEGIEETAGRRVVVIDDVCTTGGSTKQAIEKAKAAGMIVLGAICLVDRDMGAAELLRRECDCELEHIFSLADLGPEEDGIHSAPQSVESHV